MLRNYRKKNNLTQKEVADRLDISREYYAKIEEGRKVPQPEVIDKIAKMLDERLMMLFPSDDPANRALMEEDLSKYLNAVLTPLIEERGITSSTLKKKLTAELSKVFPPQ